MIREKEPKKIICVQVSNDLFEKIEQVVDGVRYSSTSHLVRAAIVRELEREKW